MCDDYVVQFGGDRREYAQRLVDIAELSSTPVAAAAVGIVSVKSLLARRIARITEPSRSLSVRAGKLLLASVVIGGLITTTAAGLVGLETNANEEEKSEDPSLVDAGAPTDESDLDNVIIRGKVVDSDGIPLGGTYVAAIAQRIGARDANRLVSASKVLAEATADEAGSSP